MKRIHLLLLRLLPPKEREYICGDLIEMKAGSALMVRQILGLLIRRQLSEWLRPGPWLALFAIALLAGYSLSEALGRVCTEISVPFDVWRQYGVAYQVAGVSMIEQTTHALTLLLVVLLSIWTGGCLLRLLSGDALWFNALAFYLMLVESSFLHEVLSGNIILRDSLWKAALWRSLPVALDAIILLPALLLGVFSIKKICATRLPSFIVPGVGLILSLFLTGMNGWFAAGYARWSGQPYHPAPLFFRFLPMIWMVWPVFGLPIAVTIFERRKVVPAI